MIKTRSALSVVMDNIDVSVLIIDIDNNDILFSNNYFNKLFGNIVGKKCWEVISNKNHGPCKSCNKDLLVKRFSEKESKNKTLVWEFFNTSLNIWFEVRDRLINWADNKVAKLQIAVDITERKQIESKLNSYKLHLEDLVKEKTKELAYRNTELSIEIYERKRNEMALKEAETELTWLTSEIHNSIKNKLESAKFFIQQGKSLIRRSPGKAIDCINKVEKLYSFINSVTRNILFVTHHRHCDSKTLYKEIDLRARLTLTNSYISYTIDKENIRDSDILRPSSVQYILEVISELFNNIAKHSRATHTNITMKNDYNYIVLVVEDNGIGFSYEKQKHKEDAYGIEIIEQLSKNYNGTVDFTTSEGNGVIVTIIIDK